MQLLRITLAWCAIVLITACGSATGSVPTTAPAETRAATAAQPSAAGAPTNAPQATMAQATTPAGFAGLPTSRTPEGYHVLGDPNAPLTIEFFSDFL